MRPKSKMILGERIKITWLKDDPAKEHEAIFYPGNMSIEIYDTVYWSKSLQHELIHAAFYVSGLSELLDDKLEEAICSCLENILFGVYR